MNDTLPQATTSAWKRRPVFTSIAALIMLSFFFYLIAKLSGIRLLSSDNESIFRGIAIMTLCIRVIIQIYDETIAKKAAEKSASVAPDSNVNSEDPQRQQ